MKGRDAILSIPIHYVHVLCSRNSFLQERDSLINFMRPFLFNLFFFTGVRSVTSVHKVVENSYLYEIVYPVLQKLNFTQ